MSSVRPTQEKADSTADPKKSMSRRWAPRVGISSWPGAHEGSDNEAENTCAVVTPPLSSLDPSKNGKA